MVLVMTRVGGRTLRDQLTSAPVALAVTVAVTGLPFMFRTIVPTFTVVSRFTIVAEVAGEELVPPELGSGAIFAAFTGEVIETTGRSVPGSLTGTNTR